MNSAVDFSFQVNLARERTEKRIFKLLCQISDKLFKESKGVGALVVLGKFDSSSVPGMRQIGMNPIQKYLNISFGQFEEEIEKILESNDDGAVIINQNGQILGTGLYLTVENPNLEIPEGTGTRHISAASFSTREDVISTFVLSEETLSVRAFKNGSLIEQHQPGQDQEL